MADPRPVDHDIALLTPELREIMEELKPGYFALTPDEREAFRATVSTSNDIDIYDTISTKVLGITKQQIAAISSGDHEMSPEESEKLSYIVQLFQGIGDDHFSWNENMAPGETALSHVTLADYVAANHEFQNAMLKEEAPNFEPTENDWTIYGEWARYLIDGEIRYGMLTDLTSFVLDAAQDAAQELINDLIPSTFEEGPEHGQRYGDVSYIFDMHRNAEGREELHDTVSKFVHNWVHEQTPVLRAAISEAHAGTVWMIDETVWNKSDHADQMGQHCIFADETAMQGVRIKHFVDDCTRQLGKFETVTDLIARMSELMTNAIRGEYRRALAIVEKDAGILLKGIEDGTITTQSTAPVASKETTIRIADALVNGFVSVRRMAKAMDTTIEDLDETFASYGLFYRTGI
jgi:hypothetical protein